jgi:exosortase
MGGFGAALLWSYWPTLGEMVGRWIADPRYSHGFLVPAFALFLLWYRREEAARVEPGIHAWGTILIAVGIALQLAGAFIHLEWVETLSLLPSLAGLFALIGGWPALRWAWPAIAFLFFMIPLPYAVENAVGQPLQRIATLSSTFALQTLGLSAIAEGNTIAMDHARVGVVEACNGLGMLFMFFAFSVAVALLIDRPLVDRLLIVAGAIPTALLANILRITITGLLHETVGSETANMVYHDLAGWLMMPLALAFLWIEIILLSHLFIAAPAPQAVPTALDLIRTSAGLPLKKETGTAKADH